MTMHVLSLGAFLSFFLTLDSTHVDAKLHSRTYYMCVCTSCTNLCVLHVRRQKKKIVQLDYRDKHNMRDTVISYLAEDVNLIYVTCRVEKWLIETYRVGRLALS